MDTAIPAQEVEVRSFFWMASVDIIYTVDGGLEKSRKVNVVVRTRNPFANQNTIGNIQQQAQIQASQFKKLPRKAKTVDVIVNGPWMIGHMTTDEFLKTQPGQTPLEEPKEEPANDANTPASE